ncbi:restriction endonuclease subunit S [uncultured Psychrobacter sp.]|uniref:restriction endonuclease subunit S n=1 Tax=uncultured Psychrobacter sp. TaxID=259303 RepID=UPI0025978F75|nr:restriction endonuclease subunit S [uncultured Psychrobacter sp.]
MSEVNVPEGYKQTEVGFIPKDWEMVRLEEIARFLKGSGLPKSDISDYAVYPCIHYGQLFTHYKEKISSISSYTNYRGKVNSLSNDILMPTSDVTPNGLATASCLLEDNIILGGDILVIRSNPNILDGVFFSYLVHIYREQVMRLVTGSTVYHLYASDMKNFSFGLPGIEEQVSIRNALSDVDNLIQSLEKLIAKKEVIKTGTMQQLLTGKTRLPDFATREDGSPKGFKQTELGQIPEDWELLSVREISDLLTGFPFPSSKYQDSGIRLLRGSNVKRGNTDWSENITKFWAESAISLEQYLLQEGDVVISMDGSLVGRSFAQLSGSDLPALLLQRVARLRTKLISQNYLKEWICSPIFSDYCDSVKTVTAIPHISPADILNFRLLIPQSKEEQTAIATILSDMDAEIQALQQRLEKTKDIKQGMMQQLLTGKVRLAH